mmetsp:Transcript_59377/g.111256  ORF Transcript_59377/g.111256 Transcript_59377/m.111256 type:complete len:152 (+) Transcript_59377:71-526(+)
MGSGASAESTHEVDVLRASPREEEFRRFRGAKQDFYDQTLRIVSDNDVNKYLPGNGPKIEHLTEVKCDHMLRKEIEWTDKSFYKSKSRLELQQEAHIETRAALMKAQKALSHQPPAVSKSKSVPSSPSSPSSPKSAASTSYSRRTSLSLAS